MAWIRDRVAGNSRVRLAPSGRGHGQELMETMALIEPRKKAPAFALNDQDGTTHKLADYEGRPLILYFYPKDDTPGCTKETCAFQSSLPKLKTRKAAVLGVSILDERSKAKFAAKYDITFPLLADADHAVAEKLRRLAGEVALRPHVHGHRAHDVPDWTGRPRAAALGQREGGRARGRGARGIEVASASAPWTRTCTDRV